MQVYLLDPEVDVKKRRHWEALLGPHEVITDVGKAGPGVLVVHDRFDEDERMRLIQQARKQGLFVMLIAGATKAPLLGIQGVYQRVHAVGPGADPAFRECFKAFRDSLERTGDFKVELLEPTFQWLPALGVLCEAALASLSHWEDERWGPSSIVEALERSGWTEAFAGGDVPRDLRMNLDAYYESLTSPSWWKDILGAVEVLAESVEGELARRGRNLEGCPALAILLQTVMAEPPERKLEGGVIANAYLEMCSVRKQVL